MIPRDLLILIIRMFLMIFLVNIKRNRKLGVYREVANNFTIDKFGQYNTAIMILHGKRKMFFF